MRTLTLAFLISLSLSVQPSVAVTIPPDIKKVVTFIFPADAQGNIVRDARTNDPVPAGTGFFVFLKDEGGGPGGYGYLVTAKHVLKTPDGRDLSRVYLRLNRFKGDADYVPLELTVDGQSRVYTHADATVDIAVVPAMPDLSVYDTKALPDEMLSGKSLGELGIAEGSDVFFAGLFVSYVGEHRNNLIVRFGRVAMLPDDRIGWQEPGKSKEFDELYLLETQSYGGNSGAPVFFYLGSDRNPGSMILGPPVIKLAGIMKGNFNEPRPIGFAQTNTSSTVPYSTQNIGIAAVTPSYLLHEILYSEGLKEFRAKHPIQPPAKK